MKYFLLASVLLSTLIPYSYAEKYDRQSHFGGWIDEDHDCQNTRAEVLIEESIIPVTLSENGCKVISGIWICPYTGQMFVNASELDIDHLVPLKEAWRSGADKWSKEERIAYANDLKNPEHLVAVSASANRSKSDKDPSDWLPNKDEKMYIIEWIDVKERYELCFDAKELKAILKELYKAP